MYIVLATYIIWPVHTYITGAMKPTSPISITLGDLYLSNLAEPWVGTKAVLESSWVLLRDAEASTQKIVSSVSCLIAPTDFNSPMEQMFGHIIPTNNSIDGLKWIPSINASCNQEVLFPKTQPSQSYQFKVTVRVRIGILRVGHGWQCCARI